MYNMEAKTIAEILTHQQENILALKITLDSLIEELNELEVIDYGKLEKKVQRRIKKLHNLAKKAQKEHTEMDIPFNLFGNPIAEA
jgi:ppGpp synthetase/RelA/SpoT-type nucleotidyltranferase